MTRKQAEKLGYEIVRGAYCGTTDDRADRWYVQHEDDEIIDRRGGGFATVKEALFAVEEAELYRNLK